MAVVAGEIANVADVDLQRGDRWRSSKLSVKPSLETCAIENR